MSVALDTGVKLVRNVGRYNIGAGSLAELQPLLASRRAASRAAGQGGGVVFLVDEFFRGDAGMPARLGLQPGDALQFVATADEPKTDSIDAVVADLHAAA
jgi:hypothetical protein